MNRMNECWRKVHGLIGYMRYNLKTANPPGYKKILDFLAYFDKVDF